MKSFGRQDRYQNSSSIREDRDFSGSGNSTRMDNQELIYGGSEYFQGSRAAARDPRAAKMNEEAARRIFISKNSNGLFVKIQNDFCDLPRSQSKSGRQQNMKEPQASNLRNSLPPSLSNDAPNPRSLYQSSQHIGPPKSSILSNSRSEESLSKPRAQDQCQYNQRGGMSANDRRYQPKSSSRSCLKEPSSIINEQGIQQQNTFRNPIDKYQGQSSMPSQRGSRQISSSTRQQNLEPNNKKRQPYLSNQQQGFPQQGAGEKLEKTPVPINRQRSVAHSNNQSEPIRMAQSTTASNLRRGEERPMFSNARRQTSQEHSNQYPQDPQPASNRYYSKSGCRGCSNLTSPKSRKCVQFDDEPPACGPPDCKVELSISPIFPETWSNAVKSNIGNASVSRDSEVATGTSRSNRGKGRGLRRSGISLPAENRPSMDPAVDDGSFSRGSSFTGRFNRGGYRGGRGRRPNKRNAENSHPTSYQSTDHNEPIVDEMIAPKSQILRGRVSTARRGGRPRRAGRASEPPQKSASSSDESSESTDDFKAHSGGYIDDGIANTVDKNELTKVVELEQRATGEFEEEEEETSEEEEEVSQTADGGGDSQDNERFVATDTAESDEEQAVDRPEREDSADEENLSSLLEDTEKGPTFSSDEESAEHDSEKPGSEQSDHSTEFLPDGGICIIAASKHNANKPGSAQSGSEKSVNDQSGAENSGSAKSGSERPGSAQSGSEKPVNPQSGSEKPENPQSGAENSGSDQSDAEKPESNQSGAEKSGSPQSGAKSSGNDQSGSEKPGSAQSGSEKPGNPQSDAEKPGSPQSDHSTEFLPDGGICIIAASKDETESTAALVSTVDAYTIEIDHSRLEATKLQRLKKGRCKPSKSGA